MDKWFHSLEMRMDTQHTHTHTREENFPQQNMYRNFYVNERFEINF
jgi:hypothetical protein